MLNPKQLEGLRLLVTAFPQQQFNATEDRRSPKADQAVACFHCHATGVNGQRLFGSQRALKIVMSAHRFDVVV